MGENERVISSPSHVIFDLDGTLMDSSPGILESFRLTLAERGREFSSERLRHLIGPPLRHSFGVLGFADDELDDVVEQYRAHYAGVGLRGATLYDGVPEALDELHQRGVRLAVATAKRVDFAERMLADHGVARFFDVVRGASLDLRVTTKEDIMGEVFEVWANPARERVWMVGDRAFDMAGAGHHGVIGVGVTWGFGTDSELSAAGASLLVSSPAELLEYATGERTTMRSRGA